MTDAYRFFADQLRFVARRTDRTDAEVALMMDSLEAVADQAEAHDGRFTVPADRLRATARALAGVAGLLQQHVLPEAVAAGNSAGEAQLRWTIDTAMTVMTALTSHAEATEDGEPFPVSLPPPPEY